MWGVVMQASSLRIVTLALAVCVVHAASAADLSVPTPVTPPPLFTWTGFYLGGHAGYGAASLNEFNAKGGFAGGQAGYNYQLGNWVVGLEGDGAWSSMSSGARVVVPSGPTTATFNANALATLRGRAGFAAGNVLIYATGGAGWGQTRLMTTSPASVGGETWKSGWTGGVGVEWAFRPNWSAKLEYVHYALGSVNYPSFVDVGNAGNLQIDTVKIGINYMLH